MSRATATQPPGQVAGLVELEPVPLTFGAHSTQLRTIAGKPMSRQRRRCPTTGDPYWVITEVPESGRDDRLPRQELFVSPGTSPAERFRDAERTAVGSGSLDLRPPDPYRNEIEQLQGEGKVASAASLRLQFPAPVVEVDPLQLFDVGEIVGISTLIVNLLKMSTPELLELLIRHRQGDHGPAVGSSAGRKLTDDEAWAPAFFAPLVRNVSAINEGSGVIVSRYSVFRPGIDDPRSDNSGGTRDRHLPALRHRDETVSMVTLLSSTGRPPRTIAISGRDSCSVA